MINWTQIGAGLGQLPQQMRTPEAVRGQYQALMPQWQKYTQLDKDFYRTGGNLVQKSAERLQAGRGLAPVIGLINYNQSQRAYPTTAAALDAVQKKGADAYSPAQLVAGRDWSLREQARANAQGPTGFGGLVFKAAPAIMSLAAGGFALPSMGKSLFNLAPTIGPQKVMSSAMSKAVKALRDS